MVPDNQMRRVAAGQFLAFGTLRRPDDFRPQSILGGSMFIIQLVFDEHVGHGGGVGRAFPGGAVKKDVFAKIFRFDEAELAVFANEADGSQTTTLDAKWFGSVVGIGSFHTQTCRENKRGVRLRRPDHSGSPDLHDRPELHGRPELAKRSSGT